MVEILIETFEAAVVIAKRIYKSLKRGQAGQIGIYRSFTSRFAATDEDLATVLQLRRAFFRKPIIPDDSYKCCWRRNPDTMKIVFDQSGKPVGYWSLIPISKEFFEQFVAGKSYFFILFVLD